MKFKKGGFKEIVKDVGKTILVFGTVAYGLNAGYHTFEAISHGKKAENHLNRAKLKNEYVNTLKRIGEKSKLNLLESTEKHGKIANEEYNSSVMHRIMEKHHWKSAFNANPFDYKTPPGYKNSTCYRTTHK